jgi:deoxycytidylate deaminase
MHNAVATDGAISVAASMNVARSGHTATLLANGKVLIAGGYNGDYLTSAEIYDPATRTFRAVGGQFDTARFFASATLLEDGRVLITGGYNDHGAASEKVWTYQANT